MRDNPLFRLDDPDEIRALVRANPFVTLVSPATDGLVASHYPVLVDDTVPHLQLLGHVGRPDDQVHELGRHEVLVIVTGEHGYVSPGWYPRDEPGVPTWNYVTAHLSGTPIVLDAEQNLAALARLVDSFEDRLPHPRPMNGTAADADYARRISAGTVGFRLPVTKIVGKKKLSQNKPATTVRGVTDALSTPGPYRNQELANLMRENERR